MQREPELFQTLLHKTNGSRSEWEYPFAAAGVNITFMLEELLDLRSSPDSPPSTAAGRAFIPLLSTNADAFELVIASYDDVIFQILADRFCQVLRFVWQSSLLDTKA